MTKRRLRAQRIKAESTPGKDFESASSMTQQKQMESFIKNIHPNDQKIFHRSDGRFKTIKQWPGITFDEEGEVFKVEWNSRFLYDGSVDVLYLPSTTEKFCATNCRLVSIGDFRNLPKSLKHLSLVKNNLTGVVPFSELPPNLETLILDENDFSGPVDLTKISSGIQLLSLSHNCFSGSLDLSGIGTFNHVCYDMYFQNNRFTGELDLSNLPTELRDIWLQENNFESYLIGNLPFSLEQLMVDFPSGMNVDMGEMVLLSKRKCVVNLMSHRGGLKKQLLSPE